MRISTVLTIFFSILIHASFAQQIGKLSKSEQDAIDRQKEMAIVYINNGELTEAGKEYSKIAFIYWKAGRPREAIDNFITSGDLLLQKNKYDEAKNVYSNIAVIYTDLEELEFALDFFEKSLVIRRKAGNKTDVSAGLIDVAYILQSLKYFDDAIEKLEEALKYATEINNSRLILNCYQLLGLNYEQTGNIRKAQEWNAKAEAYQVFVSEESLKEEFTTEVMETKKEVARSEEEKRLAAELFALRQKLYQETEDSLSTSIRSKQDSLFAAAQTAKRKQLEIENLEQARELDSARLKQQQVQQQKQKLIILMVAVGLLLMIILAIVMLRANRARKKANNKLAKQNKDIAEKSEQLGTALKKIAHQNQNITQSINYARGIQQALLPKPEQLADFIGESFILFRPRDIVSGDFYWFREIDAKSDIFKIFGMHRRDNQAQNEENEHKKFVISAVDCTGHGVPGAFMSMIGYNLLDEITNKGISRPDLILEELHRGVRFTLKQKETNNQDGMDMAVCAIDKKNKTLEFAGAKNPLVYIQDGEIQQIKGDKNGIGGKIDEHKYTTHLIKIDKPTYFYIFSDGYIDQFGGDNGRKFMIKTFREFLLEIHQKPMPEQRKLLDEKIKAWRGSKYNQIDDILVIGFKLDFS